MSDVDLSGASPRHVSVLMGEILEALTPASGQVFVDATVGAGGHGRLLAERLMPGGRLLGLDRDAAMLELACPRLAGLPATLVQAPFSRLREVLDELGVAAVDGVLADLGVCSDQTGRCRARLELHAIGPLDMRLDPTTGEPASALLRRLNERDLADLIYRYGEETIQPPHRAANRRSATPHAAGNDRGTGRVGTPLCAATEARSRPAGRSPGRRPTIDPATRVFQALRIAVNDELGELEKLLNILPACVRPGGRVAVISFHSLEDRLVKTAFRDRSLWEPLTRKPIQAGEEEVRNNPRARSAKLRARRLSEPRP